MQYGKQYKWPVAFAVGHCNNAIHYDGSLQDIHEW